jgi:predicted Rossmann fold flavoprotein
MKIAIIGGGAAGFFSAINVKENHPAAEVVIYEKSKKLLAKVRVSGGGRCNVTNGCKTIKDLSEGYPRGGKALKKIFNVFNNQTTMEWFEARGVPIYIQDDNRVFPSSNNSQTIIDCLLNEADRLNIIVELNKGVNKIETSKDQWTIFIGDKEEAKIVDKIIVATGGSANRNRFKWLENLGHKIEDPVPSLFTFNMPSESISTLMGLVVDNVSASIQGTKLKSNGPLLITHWGMSGPAILKLSAFGARVLADKAYDFNIQVSWANDQNYANVFTYLSNISEDHSNKLLSNHKPYNLPERLWLFLLAKGGLQPTKKWNELGKKGLNKLVNLLSNDVYKVKGKTTFKEEFVTCGGVSLDSIDINTMQSKVCKNLYFAGEIVDIDGITGGYNFQSAWTTGFIAGKLR